MRAISAFSREAGMSTRVCFDCTAFRMRVSMSAIGSLISSCSVSWFQSARRLRFAGSGLRTWDGFRAADPPSLPAALRHTRDVPLERQLSEAEATEVELADVGAGPPAQLAPVPEPDAVLRRFGLFRNLRG